MVLCLSALHTMPSLPPHSPQLSFSRPPSLYLPVSSSFDSPHAHIPHMHAHIHSPSSLPPPPTQLAAVFPEEAGMSPGGGGSTTACSLVLLPPAPSCACSLSCQVLSWVCLQHSHVSDEGCQRELRNALAKYGGEGGGQ